VGAVFGRKKEKAQSRNGYGEMRRYLMSQTFKDWASVETVLHPGLAPTQGTRTRTLTAAESP